VSEAKKQYYSDLVGKCDNQKELFKIIDTLLHRKNAPSFPKHSSPEELANSFSDFFIDKIQTIRTSLEAANNLSEHSVDIEDAADDLSTDLPTLSSFHPISEDEVRKIIVAAKTTTCALDPIPTEILKKCLDVLVPTITEIINRSLAEGKVPMSMKHALVVPLLKKILLDVEIFKNF
jgi:hypothetical protein